MEPDPRIVRQLRAYDDKLRVVWNPARNRWALWRIVGARQPEAEHDARKVRMNPFQDAILLWFWQTPEEDGHKFLPLDERVLVKIRLGDILEAGGAEAYDDALLEEEERNAKRVHDSGVDDVVQACMEHREDFKKLDDMHTLRGWEKQAVLERSRLKQASGNLYPGEY